MSGGDHGVMCDDGDGDDVYMCVSAVVLVFIFIICDRLDVYSTHGRRTVVCVCVQRR